MDFDLLGGAVAAPAAPAQVERAAPAAPAAPKSSGCGAISALFFLDTKGRVLLCRDYRGDVPLSCADKFISRLHETEAESELRPVLFDDGVTYTYVQHNNLYVMACATTNVNAAAILLFLHRLCGVFEEYFNELDEEVLRDNFVIVYELLDEVMDFGYPQYSEGKILAEYIKTDAHAAEKSDVKAPMAVTNAVSWRQEGITYKKNEVFLDVVESVNLLVNSNGTVVRSEVCGALKMRAFLSGMPECKLGLNDKVLMEAQGRGGGKGKSVDLEDMKFHQCVRLARFENDRTIAFIPPDGAFDVMTYRLNTQVRPLIWVECTVERHGRSRIEYLVTAKSQFKTRSSASAVEIKLPVHPDATAPAVRCSAGGATYAPEQEALLWKIKSMPGGQEYKMRAKFSLPSVQADEEVEKKPPIKVKFEIPYFTVSGIQVRYLKIVAKEGYAALPWVRYITVAGEYEIRM